MSPGYEISHTHMLLGKGEARAGAMLYVIWNVVLIVF